MNAIQESYSVEGTRFGSVSYREEDVLDFPAGVIGFPELNRFVLIANSDNGVFSWLQSLDDPEVAFLVTDPCRFAKDYHPFGDDPAGALMTTVNIPVGQPEEMTLNLAGPIVIENASRTGYQIVLENEAYTTKYRVFAKASQESGEFAA